MYRLSHRFGYLNYPSYSGTIGRQVSTLRLRWTKSLVSCSFSLLVGPQTWACIVAANHNVAGSLLLELLPCLAVDLWRLIL